MEGCFLLMLLMIMVVCIIFMVNDDEERIELSGTEVVLSDDTLTVIKRNQFQNTYVLENGVIVDENYILKNSIE